MIAMSDDTSTRQPLAAGGPGSWGAFEAAAPGLARFVRERLDARRHLVMATLRADGSPRISGIEVSIADGELWVGGLSGSLKFADLRRDPRMAIHSASADRPDWKGDARVSGRAVFVEDEVTKAAFLAAAGGPPGPFELVQIQVDEISTVCEAPTRDHLVLEVWRPGEPVREIERR